jgi:regulatory protein
VTGHDQQPPGWSAPERQRQEREAWGPRDWGTNGLGGEGFDLHPTEAEAGSGFDAGPDPAFESDQASAEASVEASASPGGRRAARSGRGRRSGRSAGERSEQDDSGTQERESADPAAQARALCLRLLTGAPKTRRQLADAMRRRELPEEVVEEVLSRYQEVGLIDDTAFAEAWVESRHRGRGLARRALAMELRSKGVDNAVVAEAVGRLDPEQEADTARQLVDRKLRSTSGLERQVRIRRLAGMLARRGYSEGLALRVVRAALDDEAESDEAEGDEHWSEG